MPNPITVSSSLRSLSTVIERHAQHPGQQTRVPRQFLTVQNEAEALVDLPYEPMVCLVVRGQKHLVVGDRDDGAIAGDVFLSVIDTPVQASFEAPYRSVALRIDDARVIDLIGEGSLQRRAGQTLHHGFTKTHADSRMIRAFTNWVGLLEEPEHIPILASRYEDEIVHRLLSGPLGAGLSAAVRGGPVTHVRRAAKYLIDNYALPTTVEELAVVAGMSRPSLDRGFRQVTGSSPVQFHRTVRLQHARKLLRSGNASVTSAAHDVGYSSPSHFHRDYKRAYGLSPSGDIPRS